MYVCVAGLYLLVRDMSQLDTLQSTLSPDFGWSLCAPRQDEATGAITGARAVRSPTNPELQTGRRTWPLSTFGLPVDELSRDSEDLWRVEWHDITAESIDNIDMTPLLNCSHVLSP